MLTEDGLLKRLAGPLAGQDARKTLPKVAPAAAAVPLVSFQQQHDVPHTPVLMPHPALVAVLVPQLGVAAVRAG